MSNHGVRSPLTQYPDNPNNIWSKYSRSTGQLTDVGMRQMLKSGRKLRAKYPHLSKTYDLTRTWAFSSDSDRNIQSAQLIMTGMYQPSEGYANWTDDSTLSGFMPIPIRTAPSECDTIFRRHATCARFIQLQAEAKLNNSAKENSSTAFLYKMRCMSSIELTYYDLWKLGDKAIVDAAHNLTVEMYITQNLPRLMEIRDDNYYVTYLYSMEQAKLISGSLLNQLVTYFDQKINATTDNEFYLYTGVRPLLFIIIENLIKK